MIDEKPFAKYKDLYRDIIFGYTTDRFKSGGEKVYVKHLTDIEVGHSERDYAEHLRLAVEKGLKTEKQGLDFLIEEDLWTQKNEDRITALRDRLSHLRDSRDKLIVKTQLKSLDKEIKPLDDELYILNYERIDNLGVTAEIFANKKISESTIRQCFFKDKDLTTPFYTEEDYDYLSQEEVNEGLEIYGNMMGKRFAGDEIKRVSVCPFFMNVYYLCNDNAYHFFGNPVLHLTNFQVALMSYGKNFKAAMSNNKPPPEDYTKHPDKVIEWYDMQQRTAMATKHEQKGEASGQTVFGASREELESMKKEGESVLDLTDEVKKQGGEMDLDQILKMHGL